MSTVMSGRQRLLCSMGLYNIRLEEPPIPRVATVDYGVHEGCSCPICMDARAAGEKKERRERAKRGRVVREWWGDVTVGGPSRGFEKDVKALLEEEAAMSAEALKERRRREADERRGRRMLLKIADAAITVKGNQRDEVLNNIRRDLLVYGGLMGAIKRKNRPEGCCVKAADVRVRGIVSNLHGKLEGMTDNVRMLYKTLGENDKIKNRWRQWSRGPMSRGDAKFLSTPETYKGVKDGRLMLQTPFIVIKVGKHEVKFGRFIMYVPLELMFSGGRQRLANLKVKALEPNEVDKEGSIYVHPHIAGGGSSLCLGETGGELIRRALMRGDLVSIYDTVCGILQEYNPNSPYCVLSEWLPGFTCSICSGYIAEETSDDEAAACRLCGRIVCKDTCGSVQSIPAKLIPKRGPKRCTCKNETNGKMVDDIFVCKSCITLENACGVCLEKTDGVICVLHTYKGIYKCVGCGRGMCSPHATSCLRCDSYACNACRATSREGGGCPACRDKGADKRGPKFEGRGTEGSSQATVSEILSDISDMRRTRST